MREYIDKITKMCQGNIGALTILERLLTNTECIDILERYNICGSDIWQLYKDCCHENIDLMTTVLHNLPSENIKYHINHGNRGIEYDRNIINGNDDDWIILALNDFKEYSIYGRMELENFGVYPAQPPELVGSYYSIWIKTRNQKKLRFNLTMEQLKDMKLNIYIHYLLEEIEKFCKHNSLREAMKLDEAIKHCREIANQCEISNKDRISAGFIDTCCKDHLQLMEWLIELKKYKTIYGELP